MACLDHQLRFTNWPLKLNIDTPSSHIWNETIFSKAHHFWSLCENLGNQTTTLQYLGCIIPGSLLPWFVYHPVFFKPWDFGHLEGVVTQPDATGVTGAGFRNHRATMNHPRFHRDDQSPKNRGSLHAANMVSQARSLMRVLREVFKELFLK